MTEQALPLTEFYGGWANYQRALVEMIAPLTPELLAQPAAPGQWTIGMIAQHIVGNRAWWFHVWMDQGKPEIGDIAHWDPQDRVYNRTPIATDLIEGLNSTWQMIESALASWTATDLDSILPQPSALLEEERSYFQNLTRRWIIWHTFEHEIHHGGELSLALGTRGLPGIYNF